MENLMQSDLTGIAVCSIVTLIAYTVYSYKKTYSFWSSRGIKGPFPLPFFGNSLTYILNIVPDVDIANREKFGKIYGVYDGLDPVLIISDPEIIEKIFITEHNSFRYHINFVSPDEMISNQILFKRGEELKRVRSLFTSGMTQAKLKLYFELIKPNDLINYLESNIGQEVNVYDMLSIHMLNVLTQVFYGLDLDLFSHQNHNLIPNAKNLFVTFNSFSIYVANNWPMIAKFLPDPSTTATNYLRSLVTFALNERKKILEAKGDRDRTRNDFLQQVMDSNLTEIEKLSNSIFAIGAGFDTTSFTMSYMMYELGKDKPVTRKLQEEIDQLFGEETDKKITFDDLAKLSFLENCFTETLRLHPTDVRLFRQSSEVTKIPCTDVTIPANVTINVPSFVLHSDPDVFAQPQDFDPDRWSEERKGSIKNCSFMAFGAGPRKCPGGQFALMNAKMALVQILKRYDLEVSKRSSLKLDRGMLIPYPRNIWIEFTPRNQNETN